MPDNFVIPDKWIPSLDGSDEAKVFAEIGRGRYENALADRTLATNDREAQSFQAYQQALGQMGQASPDGNPLPNSDKLMRLGQAVMPYDPGKAGTLFYHAQQLTDREQRIKDLAEAAKAGELKKAQDSQMKALTMFSGVRDQDDFDRTMSMVNSMGIPTTALPPGLQTYDPAAIEHLKTIGLPAAKAAAGSTAEYVQGQINERDRQNREARAAIEKAREVARAAESKRKEDAAKRAAKNQGKPDVAFNAGIEKQLLATYPDMEQESASQAATDLGAEAQRLFEDNKGFNSKQEALGKAIKDAQDRGDFAPSVTHNMILPDKKTTRYKRVTPYLPPDTFPLPPTKSDMDPGKKYYVPGQGAIMSQDGGKTWIYDPETREGGRRGQ